MRDAGREQARWAFWQFVVGGIGLVGLSFTVIFARQAARASIEASKHSASSAESSQSAARTSRDTLLATQENANRQLRAYVSVQLTALNAHTTHRGIMFEIKYKWKNFGQTPAHKVVNYIKFHIVPYPLPEGYELTAGSKEPLGSFTLHPGEERTGNAVQLISEDKIRNIVDANHHLVIFGRCSYEDIFGIARETQFSGLAEVKVFFEGYKLGKGATQINLAGYIDHNSAT